MNNENTSSKYSFPSAQQVTIVEGDMPGSINYNVSSGFNINVLKADIESLLNQCDDNTKEMLKEALSALNENNENKFKSTLKKVYEIGKDIFTKVSAEFLISYMRQVGIIS